MFPLCALVMLLCLPYRGLCIGIPVVILQVDYGKSAVLQCDGSAFKGEDGSVLWEVMGVDVAILQGEEPKVKERFEGRVQLPSKEQLREGNWSVVLSHARFSDGNIYQCIWDETRTLSTIWLQVMEPHVERSITVNEDTVVELPCYVQHPRTPSDNLEVWWTRNGNLLPGSRTIQADREDYSLSVEPKVNDSGEYQCWYKTRRSDTSSLGIPESVTLTVLEKIPTDNVLNPEERTTKEDWVWTTLWPPTLWAEETTDFTNTLEPDEKTTAVNWVWTVAGPEVEGSTQPMTDADAGVSVVTEPQPTEKATSSPDEDRLLDAPELTSGSFLLETFPWIRVGLIGGVLLLTSVVVCVLGALRQI
ncbi:uncharacterized protein PAE49_012634 [Odontesthes bonariensis]|uniref:uncharacterized protein LOC142391275 n=1 Tax=Odontesthes bonariensis TaxID=219752 RepID=UPI003F58CDBA